MPDLTRSAKRALLSEHPQGDPRRGAPFGERTDPGTIGIISAIGSGLGAVSTIAGMGKKDSAPAPIVSKPTTMPTPDDAAAKAAKRRALAGATERRGRQSTILSDDTAGDLLGG